jgi:hypothetical protein
MLPHRPRKPAHEAFVLQENAMRSFDISLYAFRVGLSCALCITPDAAKAHVYSLGTQDAIHQRLTEITQATRDTLRQFGELPANGSIRVFVPVSTGWVRFLRFTLTVVYTATGRTYQLSC